MIRPPAMDRLVESARAALAAGRKTVLVRVPIHVADLLFFGKVVRTEGDLAVVEIDARVLVEMGNVAEA